ncbi:hemerythrin domain-containing protein [Sphingomonas sp. LY29]|uniref:hemerythrin domain-containing protein n=1 Tax=Sphingomonas sp. LY29 TaxID=3095341 RepID=UPI002D793DDF|nr:hemerythrin domain-containing protein [Sphingomonas sp. LY29]WRP26370.1 hemerythrin domain-containing protein [Sphingomonas sp. LY29]
MSARKGSWAESLAAEHKMVLALFDKALATNETDKKKRALLLMQIGHALDKHAYAEEHVVYPALREANSQSDAEQLETEHGEVKTFLYRLHNTEVTSPDWISIMRDFRNSVAAHARLEEDVIFPRLRSEIDDELDEKITSDVNKAGFMMA